jgi:putative modified peptide
MTTLQRRIRVECVVIAYPSRSLFLYSALGFGSAVAAVRHPQGEHRVSKNTVAGAQLDKILDRMQNDAAFREKLLGDPAGALAEHGVDVDPATIPAVRKLPSADSIAQQRDALKSKIDGRAGLALFLLSA